MKQSPHVLSEISCLDVNISYTQKELKKWLVLIVIQLNIKHSGSVVKAYLSSLSHECTVS